MKKFVYYIQVAHQHQSDIRLVSIAMSACPRIAELHINENTNSIRVTTEQEVIDAFLVLFPSLQLTRNGQRKQ
ncbi:MAG: hypothetical protein G01um101448_250 [Parcubacteria group bacterium Gr01-1014_48]|nr:MAG: hypothetical protein Greene041614_66 [Parcubacteria group bacterium Greene0416_14]TSC74252.1 MAG: hypothetical protein G01um101448_250 [Parcubacteria group bacterium Gr01-1014_48]TSD01507.1 MAG: hypothetical protein Greene101415_223 [Parcubacteria group bacterium Greene1014_15]TSD08329.1 MAG: hypothetical protein Greene07144_180 [Parcubacteria group bacterium Greene0714_4]